MSQVAIIHPQAQQLVRYEAACKALAEAKAVDEVQDIRSKADAMRIYGMQAKNKTLEVDAAEIRIRAERRLGELLIQQKSDTGLNTGNQFKTAAVTTCDRREVPTLAEAGIDKNLSSRAQKLAAVPRAEFEAEVEGWRERVEAENARVTTRLVSAGERAQGKTVAPTIETLAAENATLRADLAEAMQNAQELSDALAGHAAAEEGEAAAAAEITRLLRQLSATESQRDRLMVTNSELKKEVKMLRRKLGQSA